MMIKTVTSLKEPEHKLLNSAASGALNTGPIYEVLDKIMWITIMNE